MYIRKCGYMRADLRQVMSEKKLEKISSEIDHLIEQLKDDTPISEIKAQLTEIQDFVNS